ncbi:MAG: zinc ribbon domain-containing protein [Ruminiclostridium sp.]|nr:zinc ribbon domain-containing protein [Ruminiclostridium sp.]
MSSMWDDIMMGARVANSFFKGAEKVGKMAKKGIQSEKFQNLKQDLQNKAANSETLQNLSAELKQRVGQVSTAEGKHFCIQCGTSLPTTARFCSQCGAPQPQEDAPSPSQDEDPTIQEPPVWETTPKAEDAPVIFDFSPSGTSAAPVSPTNRVQMLVKKPGKHPEAFFGTYHYDNPQYNFDMRIFQDGDLIRVSFFDHVSLDQRHETFDDWLTGGNGLYCHALHYSFRFFMDPDGSVILDAQENFPGLEGRYTFLE